MVLTRSDALPFLNQVLVAPLTRTIRSIPTEVLLGSDDGVCVESVASFDNVASVPRSELTRRLGQLEFGRWHEVCRAMRAAIAC